MDLEQMRRRCGDHFRVVGRAVLRGYGLRLNKECEHVVCANVERDENDYVEGVLYEIDDVCLEALDDYEGYPDEYDRIQVDVQVDDRVVKSWIYVARPDRVREGLRPDEEYVRRVLRPCEMRILSDEYCRRLRSLLGAR